MFSSTAPPKTTPTTSKTPPTSKDKMGGLFSDEDEEDSDIFSQLSTMKSKEAPPTKATPKATPTALFGDDNEGLFEDDPVAPPTSSKREEEDVLVEESPKPIKKKPPAGAVSMFGGVDLFAKSESNKLEESGKGGEGGDLFTSMKEAGEAPKMKKKEDSMVSGRGTQSHVHTMYCERRSFDKSVKFL